MSLFDNKTNAVYLSQINSTSIFASIKKVGKPLNVVPVPNKHPSVKELFPSDRSKEIIFNTIKPLYSVLRAMSALPLQLVSSGKIEFRFASPIMVYSIVLFTTMMGYASYIGVTRLHIVKTSEGRFEEAVVAYLFIVNLLQIFFIPILWYECRKIAKVLNDWNDFEVLYNRICKQHLPIKLKNKAFIIAIVLPIFSTISVVITHIAMVHFKFLQVIPYCFCDTLTYIVVAFWYVLCKSLSDSANVLEKDLQKALCHIRPAALISDFRALWLRLSKLARDTGISFCYTLIWINLYLFFVITLSIYGILSQMATGLGVKDIGLALTAGCNTVLLFYICDEAHHVSQNVQNNFQKKLLLVELGWMNTAAQLQINMFIRATEMNSSNINFGGFFEVNRNLFKGLLTTMVTYLVVLLQFQISLPEEHSILPIFNVTTVDPLNLF